MHACTYLRLYAMLLFVITFLLGIQFCFLDKNESHLTHLQLFSIICYTFFPQDTETQGWFPTGPVLGVSLVLVGDCSSDGVTIKMPHGLDVLHRPASHG